MASGGQVPLFLCYAATVAEPDRPARTVPFEPHPDPVDSKAMAWYDEPMIENLKDKVLEGKWQYHHYQNNHYVFENIYNGNTIALRLRQVQNLLEGKDTIARIQCRRIWKDGKSKTQWQDNSVIKGYTHQIEKYRKSRSGN